MRVALAVDGNQQFRLLTRVLIRSLRRHNPGIAITVMDSGGGDALEREGCAVWAGRPRFDQALGKIDSSAAYFRLDIPELFPDDEHVLYLDVDMLCAGSIEEVLVRQPAYTAMVREETRPWARSRALLRVLGRRRRLEYGHEGRRYFVPLSGLSPTYNSGLMVIHARRWREERIGPRVRSLIEQNRAVVATHGDQIAINAFFGHYPHPTDVAESERLERSFGPLRRGLGSRLRGALGLLAEPAGVIEDVSTRYNATPSVQGTDAAAIVHFRGPKPWQRAAEKWRPMTGPEFDRARIAWLEYLEPTERRLFDEWEAAAP